MAVYLIGFALSTFLIAISEKKHRNFFAFCSFFALLIPCLIAAFRATTVGTDVEVYVTRLTDAAISSTSFSNFRGGSWSIGYRDQLISDYEIGFSVMLYFVAKLTHSLPAVLFTIQALVILPIYTALARNRKKMPVWLGMLVFYLLFYNATLNMMRQWIAMPFLLLAFQMLAEKKYLRCAIFSAVSLLFHLSAILVIPVYVVYWFLQTQKHLVFQAGHVKITGRMLCALVICMVALAAVLNLHIILRLLTALGIDRFNNYLEGNQISLMISQVVLRLPPIALMLFNWKQLRKYTPHAVFFLAMLLLDVVAAQLISVDVYAFRIGHYFLQYIILAAPAMYACRKKGFERTLTVLLLIGYFLFYWYFTYVQEGRHATYPYIFNHFL